MKLRLPFGEKPKKANSIFHASRWRNQSGGVRKDSRAPDGDSIGAMEAGAWIDYGPVDFGSGRLNLFMGFVAAAVPGRRMEIRLGAPDGEMIGTLSVPAEGDGDLFREQCAPIREVRGVHELFLAFPDGAVGVDWFIFSVDPDQETAAQREERMRWWREARFGQFIHWGAYSVLARGEWVMYQEKWTVEDYEKRAAAEFRPNRFRAPDWARAAKDAGQKYFVFTSKHHDGFSMFDTRVRGFDPVSFDSQARRYDVVDFTPRHVDPVRELAWACRRAGVRFCLYYSILDWHHSSQTPVYDGSGLTEMLPGWKDRYIPGMKEQLRELVEHYDPDVLWFDGDWGGEGWWWTAADGAALYRYVRILKPQIIINERVKRDSGLGDFRSPEQNIPATGLPYDWETCMTMNANWGYHAEDRDWKSAATLIHNLVDIASKGGNFLLNVGPKADGTLPRESLALLKSIGRWMRVNGESIYGTTASPFADTPVWGRFTKKPGRLYAHVFEKPPDDLLRLPTIRNPIRRIFPLDHPKRTLTYRNSEDGIWINLPKGESSSCDEVIVLEVEGIPAPAMRQGEAIGESASQ